MESEVIYSSPNAIIWYYAEEKIVHHKIINRPSAQEMHTLLSFAVETIQARGAQKWLSEDLPNMAYTKEKLEKGSLAWFPKAVEAGWKYWAIIKTKNVIGQLNHELLMKKYGAMGIEARFFDDTSLAMEWLKSLPQNE